MIYTCEICGISATREIFGPRLKYNKKYTCATCRRILYSEHRKQKRANMDAVTRDEILVRMREYYALNKEAILKTKRERRVQNPDEARESYRASYLRNRENNLNARLSYYENNKTRLLSEMKKYRTTNTGQIKLTKSKYYVDNKARISENSRIYRLKRRKSDPYYKMKQLLRSRLWGAMKLQSKNGKTKSCKEYGIDFSAIFNKLGPRPNKSHELDHIIPLAVFNLDDPNHVKLAHSPCNLQWIDSSVNRTKSNKIPELAYYYPPLWEILVEIGVLY